jgi:hypothetical protein
VEKARRGLDDSASTVVVLGTLNWLNGNDRNPENQARADSLFALGKTRHPLTIRGEDPADSSKPGILQGNPDSGKRVLYIGPGAEITLLNITITGGRQTGGGIYASGATLTLGPGTTITGNQSYDLTAGEAGGIYMEGGILVMEAGSSVTLNKAYYTGGVQMRNSRLTMNGGRINENSAVTDHGGLCIDGCTVEMFDGAEINENKGSVTGGGVSMAFCEFTMHSGSKIIGNKLEKGIGGGLYVTGESKLVMEDGSIVSGNECGTGDGGGVVVIAGSSFTMENGALIKGNTAARHGGGVLVDMASFFTMEGGGITGNTAKKNGGGVFVYGNASFVMEGGAIAGNTAEEHGGGLYLNSLSNPGVTSFTITGGTIYGDNANPDTLKNEAKAAADNPKSHAVYDNRTKTAKSYNETVTTANFSQ